MFCFNIALNMWRGRMISETVILFSRIHIFQTNFPQRLYIVKRISI
jgi:hypothetical protein